MRSSNHRIAAVIFGVVCLAALVVLTGGLYVDRYVADIDANPATHFPVLKDDSMGYVQLANTLATTHHFSSDGSTPEVFRTPGYPVFIILGELFGSIIGVSVLQILCLGATAVLVFLMGKRLYGRAVGTISALVFGLSPNAIFHTVVVLSDIPFTFFLTLVVYALFFTRPSWRAAAAAGVCLAVAAYLRPIGLYTLLVFVPFLIYRGWHDHRIRLAFKEAIVLCAVFAVLVAPWIIRNGIEAGSYSFSSVSTYNFAYYNVSAFLMDRYGVSSPQYTNYEHLMGSYSFDYLRSFAAVPTLKSLISGGLSGNIARYAIFHIESTSKFFLSSSVRYVVEQIEIPAFENWFGWSSASPDLLPTLIHGHFLVIAETLRTQMFITVDRAVMIVLTLCAFASLLFVRRNYFYTLLFVAFLLYFAILTGPVSVPRYRLPVEPYLYLLAVSTIATLYSLLRRARLS